MNIATLYNQITYTLTNDVYGSIEIPDPIGFLDDVPETIKSSKNFSTVTNYSTNLEFVLSGAKYIKTVYDNLGFDASIVLSKKSIHPTKSEVKYLYQTILDGYTYTYEKGKVKINSIEKELTSLISTYESDDLELNNTEALNGNSIGELKIDTCLIDGKDLLFISKWKVNEDFIEMDTDDFSKPTSPLADIIYQKVYAVPFQQISSGDVQDYTITSFKIPMTGFTGSFENGRAGTLFYSLAVREVDLNLTIDINQSFHSTGNHLSSFKTILLLIKYKRTDDDDYAYNGAEVLAEGTGTHYDQELTYFGQITKRLQKGESYAIGVHMINTQTGFHNDWHVEITTHKADLTSRQDSHVDWTHSQTLLPFELFERLLRIMTGRNDFILESNYFGRKDLGYDEDGEGAYLGVASGFWAREFKDKPFVTSWKDAIDSYGVVCDISYNILTKGLLEYVKLEPLNPNFFTDKVTILPNVVDDGKITIAKDFSFSSIEIGYEKGGDVYEEAAGLDEFNGKHNYTTPIKKNKTKLSLISKYRADMTGFEFARRKPRFNYETEDTRYDMDNFFLDMKKGDTEILLQRKKDDDYISISGIYSPETATNLRLSPKQLLVKKGWFIKNCLTSYTDKDIHFISATGNSKLILDDVKESDNYLIDLLDNEKFINVNIEFSHKTNLALYDEIQNNISGIIEFTDDKGNKNRVRLFKLSKNKYKAMLIK